MRRPTALPMLALLALLAAAPATATAQEEIYKWVDENGVVHFGERPPANADARRVEVEPAPAVTTPPPPPPDGEAPADAADTAPAGEEELSYAEQRRRERAEARAEALHEQQVMEENCKRMRAQVAALEPNPRVIVTDEDGQARRLSDDERLSALEEAQKYIAENCEGR